MHTISVDLISKNLSISAVPIEKFINVPDLIWQKGV